MELIFRDVCTPPQRHVNLPYHAGLHLLGLATLLASFIVGVIFMGRYDPHVPRLRSTHSFLGVVTMVLAAIQLPALLLAFSYRNATPPPWLERLAPTYRYLSIATFATGLSSMAAGLQERQVGTCKCFINYKIKLFYVAATPVTE